MRDHDPPSVGVAGRPGVARRGTADEHPLRRDDLRLLERIFGSVSVDAPSLMMFRLIDRQVTGERFSRLTRAIKWLDRNLGRIPGTTPLSYEQVIVCRTR